MGISLCRVDDTQAAVFNDKRRELAARVSRGIDRDAVGMKFDIPDRAVSVDNDFAEIAAVAQKFLSYPNEVVFRLKR